MALTEGKFPSRKAVQAGTWIYSQSSSGGRLTNDKQQCVVKAKYLPHHETGHLQVMPNEAQTRTVWD